MLVALLCTGALGTVQGRTHASPHHHSHLSHTQMRPTTKKKWTVLIYIQACNNLDSFAKNNLDGMMATGSNDDINILVEYQKPTSRSQMGNSWRYHVAPGKLVADEIVSRPPIQRDRDQKIDAETVGNEVFDSMSWAVNNYPAEKYALIFWNHGLGVLDPRWDMIQPPYMKQPTWRTPLLEPTRATRNKIASERGILFDEERQTYMTNAELRKTLKRISDDLLNGKKIEVVGMDACLMGMFEVVYQIKEYTHHFVASQEFEFAQGWSYGPLMRRLAQCPHMDGKEFCSAVVDTFDDYYGNKTSYYTQSSVSTQQLDQVHESINTLSEQLIALKKVDARGMNRIIQSARDRCLAFSLPDYIDLHSFYDELKRLVDNAITHPNGSAINPCPPQIDKGRMTILLTTLEEGHRRMQRFVTSNKTGRYLNRAKGISLYYPQHKIDTSYLETEFAQDNKWLHFLAQQLNDQY